MPWGSSLGFAKFPRGEEAIPDLAPMNEPANSLLFLPPGDFDVQGKRSFITKKNLLNAQGSLSGLQSWAGPLGYLGPIPRECN